MVALIVDGDVVVSKHGGCFKRIKDEFRIKHSFSFLYNWRYIMRYFILLLSLLIIYPFIRHKHILCVVLIGESMI